MLRVYLHKFDSVIWLLNVRAFMELFFFFFQKVTSNPGDCNQQVFITVTRRQMLRCLENFKLIEERKTS